MDETPQDPQDSTTAPVPEPPRITTADEWQRKACACWLLTLPSGARVKCRRPDFGRLIGDGIINASDLMQDTGTNDPRARYNVLVPLARAVAPYIAVAPRLAPPGYPAEDGSAAIEKVPEIDLVAMFLWAGGWSTATPAVECAD